MNRIHPISKSLFRQLTAFAILFGLSVLFPIDVVAQTNCTYSFSATNAELSQFGGSGTFNVVASSNGCSWTVTSDKSWLHATNSGIGNGVVNYNADPNGSASPRSGTISLLNQKFTVNVEGVPLPYGMPHVFSSLSRNPTTGVQYNSDGAWPYAGLILADNTLYGTASAGGSVGSGTLFQMDVGTATLNTLHHFTGYPSDGESPRYALCVLSNKIYGTSFYGGSSGYGTVFKVDTNGNNFTVLHNFPAPGSTNEGYYAASLIVVSNTLYGTTQNGGTSDKGTIFAIKPDGSGFTNLFSFSGSNGSSPGIFVSSGNTLYGTASGGSFGSGTIFRIAGDGTAFSLLYNFPAATAPSYINSDGAYPAGGLYLQGNTLYGSAGYGGSFGKGTVYKIETSGSNFSKLHDFSGSDGSAPNARFVSRADFLFGTTRAGGNSDYGTVFAINTNGTTFLPLHKFSSTDGRVPNPDLCISDNSLYGMTHFGGVYDHGTVFQLSLGSIGQSIPLSIVLSQATNIVLTWPTDGLDAGLEYATNLYPPMIWTPVSQNPVLLFGRNTVTNQMFGRQRFYRLRN